MKCIYLDKEGVCKAVPSHVNSEYKPDQETLKTYCEHPLDMHACPRLRAYQKHLEVSCAE